MATLRVGSFVLVVSCCAAACGEPDGTEITATGGQPAGGATTGGIGTGGATTGAGTGGSIGVSSGTGVVGSTGGTGDTGATFGATGTTGGTVGGATVGGAGTIGSTGVTSGTGTGAGGSTGGTGDTGATSGATGITSGTTGGAPGAGCGKPAGLTSGRASIDVNGMMREYILLLPDDYDPNRPYKLIFGWHPLGTSAESIASRGYYGLEDPSAGTAIFVAPDGLAMDGDQGWWNTDGQDVDFYFAMLGRFRSELCIDDDRIFSTGFSFGAMFSFTLACTPDSMTRAIAPAAGRAARCGDSTPPVAVMAFIGVNDSLLSGHRQGVTDMAGVNGCSEEPTEMSMSWCDGLNSSNHPCVCVEYQNCTAGYPVVSCEYEAGHTFAPNAGQTTWDFFAQF